MQSYAEYYGGREKIPDEIEALVKKRCQVDTVDRSTRKDQRKRNMTDEQQDAERAHQKKQKLERREKLSPEEAEALEEGRLLISGEREPVDVCADFELEVEVLVAEHFCMLLWFCRLVCLVEVRC